MKHANATMHENSYYQIMADLSRSEFLAADVRAGLTTRHVDPIIELVIDSRAGELIQPNGIPLLRNPSLPQQHLTWKVRNFRLAEWESDDPTIDYLNGRQIVDAAGIASGHAHLHVSPLKDWHQSQFASASKLPMPADYRFFGGKKWYSTTSVGGVATIKSLKLDTTFVPGEFYWMEFILVHVDDSMLNTEKHGNPTGRLATVFQVLS